MEYGNLFECSGYDADFHLHHRGFQLSDDKRGDDRGVQEFGSH